MKKYKLNQAYIDRQLALYTDVNATKILKIAEERLNEQANDCKSDIIRWALQGISIEQIHDKLVEWNNHTLANHMEVVQDIYDDAIKNADVIEKSVTYHRLPTKAEIAFGYGAMHYIEIPYLECINRFGNPKKRIKAKDGHWYSR
jgi:hypothetical protein